MGGVGVLQEIEDLADDALPSSTDGRDNHVHGASKYCQIGVSAWEALLSGVIGGVGLTDVPGAIIIDLYPRTGDLLESFCRSRALYSTSLFYVGIGEDQIETTWIHKMAVEALANRIEQGNATIPGVAKLETAISEDLIEPLPKVPDMNRLIISGEKRPALAPQLGGKEVAAAHNIWQGVHNMG